MVCRFILIAGSLLLLISILLISSTAQAAEPTVGGTDGNITVFGEQEGGREYWNVIHHFVLIESDVKVDEFFNVTICENITFDEDNETFFPAGHIFGQLGEIRWDDEPEPSIEITPQDFDLYKEDWLTLTVYILGEYYRNTTNGNESGEGGERELRQAYRVITVHRWNDAPVPVVMSPAIARPMRTTQKRSPRSGAPRP